MKKNQLSRKVFGEREVKIIEKQLYGVALTQSEKNRLSRDIRKKFEFIQQAARYEEEFKLKKGVEIKKIIEDSIEIIKNHQLFPKIKTIKVYGSFVENRSTLFSDVDIAVIFDTITIEDATKFRINVLGECSGRADIQVYNVLPDKIKKEIDKKGRIAYEREDNRQDTTDRGILRGI
ncbi:nucleotidyltransferase domain-containing protein [Candidatus Woesearchaeota archaeon]|nr:nucleotidyltransferase domain-containing protein [Candidatus Woesearchaeota archaeon]